MKKAMPAIRFTIISSLIALATLACGRDGMMMNDDKMMGQMQQDPQMMQQMMAQMHKDPQMMQQMMAQMHKDPKMMQQMSEWMVANPAHCAQMAEHMSRNPEACRNMMQAMATQMDPADGQQMMGFCEKMMKGAGTAAAPASATPAVTSTTEATSSAAAQEFTVAVSGSGFSPASLAVKKGQPVRIHFKRDGQPTCADEVVFPSLNIRRNLPPSATTTVEVTPTKEGDLTFACGMNMLKGKLVVSG